MYLSGFYLLRKSFKLFKSSYGLHRYGMVYVTTTLQTQEMSVRNVPVCSKAARRWQFGIATPLITELIPSATRRYRAYIILLYVYLAQRT